MTNAQILDEYFPNDEDVDMEKIELAVDRLTKRGLIRQKGSTRTKEPDLRCHQQGVYVRYEKLVGEIIVECAVCPQPDVESKRNDRIRWAYVALDPTELEEFLAVEGRPALRTAEKRGLL
jgi:hypothetical protein